MKVELLREERGKGRVFVKRMKEAWDIIHNDKPVTAECLRDNAARFNKDRL